MTTIYGSIGYTVLKKGNTACTGTACMYIIIFADKHDNNIGCDNDIDMAGWFEKKFTSSNLILEEVPRDNNSNLKELWPNSYHTQNLKKIYIKNSHIIKGIDIRPFLIPFSWELPNIVDINLFEYLKSIDEFFSLKNIHCLKTLPIYIKMQQTNLGKHFMKLKTNFYIFLIKHQLLLVETIYNIKQNNRNVLEELNDILDNIMEWYTIANINEKHNNIIHVGLAHSEKIIDNLVSYYDYIIIEQQGINNIKQINNSMSGCVRLSQERDTQFGGELNNIFL